MVALIENWYLVHLYGDEDGTDLSEWWGRVLWGHVLMDASGKFEPGQFVCSSPVVKFIPPSVKTRSGVIYSLHGQGERVDLPFKYFHKLRNGISPAKLLPFAKDYPAPP